MNLSGAQHRRRETTSRESVRAELLTSGMIRTMLAMPVVSEPTFPGVALCCNMRGSIFPRQAKIRIPGFYCSPHRLRRLHFHPRAIEIEYRHSPRARRRRAWPQTVRLDALSGPDLGPSMIMGFLIHFLG